MRNFIRPLLLSPLLFSFPLYAETYAVRTDYVAYTSDGYFDSNGNLVKGKYDLRGVFRFINDASAVSFNPQELDQLASWVAPQQDTTDGPSLYGNLPVQTLPNEPYYQPSDGNIAIFVLSDIAMTMRNGWSNLLPSTQSTLIAIAQHALTYAQNYGGFGPDYTNITILRAADYILLGESGVTDDQGHSAASIANLGYQAIATLQSSTANNPSFTSQYGICEFLSPTYYGVDLFGLGMIQNYTGNSAVKFQATALANLIWTDAAENFFTPSQRLCGAFSRAKEHQYSHGTLDNQLLEAGWIARSLQPDYSLDGTFQPSEVDCINSYAAPPAFAFPSMTSLPYTIEHRWGVGYFNGGGQWDPTPARTENYVSNSFSLGTASRNYCQEDLPMTISLAQYAPSSPEPSMVTIIPDGWGSDYGTNVNTISNPSLPNQNHLQPTIIANQNQNQALVMLMYAGDQRDKNNEKMGSHGYSITSYRCHNQLVYDFVRRKCPSTYRWKSHIVKPKCTNQF